MAVLYVARHVWPVCAPPLKDAGVLVDGGRIVALGPRRELPRLREAERRDLGDVAVLPGCVNAHAHLELSWLRERRPPGGDYWTWIRGVVEAREQEDPMQARRAAEQALAEAASRGTVALGDVGHASWCAEVLARGPLRGVLFYELLGFPSARAEAILAEAVAQLDVLDRAAGPRFRVALSPHAPHTTSPALLKALAGRARAAGAPLSIHVAESRLEVEFLQQGHEGYARWLEARGAWDASWTPPHQSPVEYLDRLQVLFERTLAVHAVQLGQGDMQRLQARGVTVVTCPRSNAYLGVGTAPVPQLLRAGVPVALGTDSLASVENLDPFAEIAALLRTHPGLSPAAALRMATLNGARALGLTRDLGTIEAGKLAELIAIPCPATRDPWEVLREPPAQVWRLEEAPWEKL